MALLKSTILTILSFFALVSFAQKPTILAGPMPGYIEHKETAIWLQTQCAKKSHPPRSQGRIWQGTAGP